MLTIGEQNQTRILEYHQELPGEAPTMVQKKTKQNKQHNKNNKKTPTLLGLKKKTTSYTPQVPISAQSYSSLTSDPHAKKGMLYELHRQPSY